MVNDVLAILESIFGWVYFVSWSATFYPQVTLIFKRRNGSGFSIDFMTINNVGFLSYTIFTLISYSNQSAQQSYQQHTGYLPQVETNDVFFAIHGTILCFILTCQLLYYPPRNNLPKTSILIISLSFLSLVFIGLLLSFLHQLDWFLYLRFAGNIKVLASLIKHIPQVYLNRSRQSTVGFSFSMVLLDVIGGTFSIAQQTIKCFRIKSLAPFTSNYAKTFLAIESLLFDFYFITQHLLWYTDRYDIDLYPSIKHTDNNHNIDSKTISVSSSSSSSSSTIPTVQTPLILH